MGYYYKDPSGLGTWYVNDNETPSQAFDRYFGGTGASVDDRLRQSVANTPAAHQLAWQAPPPPPPSVPVGPPAPAAAPESAVHRYTPQHGTPKITMPPIRSNIAPVVTGEPISTAILTGLAVVFSILGHGMSKEVKQAIEQLRSGIKDVFNILMGFIWTMSHIARWILNALRQLWENVLKPLIDDINDLISRVGQIINKVLPKYLDLIQKIRKHILEIYVRWFVPVIRVIQQIRVMLSILRLLHVPGVAALDAKLAKIEGKLIGVIQQVLYRVNDHSGLFNILLTARLTLQRGILLPSFSESRGSFINAFYNYQSQPGSVAKPQPVSDTEVIAILDDACKAFHDVLTVDGGVIQPADDFCRILSETLLRE
jgi:hypothetical protein